VQLDLVGLVCTFLLQLSDGFPKGHYTLQHTTEAHMVAIFHNKMQSLCSDDRIKIGLIIDSCNPMKSKGKKSKHPTHPSYNIKYGINTMYTMDQQHDYVAALKQGLQFAHVMSNDVSLL
jgi:hypothetical protein